MDSCIQKGWIDIAEFSFPWNTRMYKMRLKCCPIIEKTGLIFRFELDGHRRGDWEWLRHASTNSEHHPLKKITQIPLRSCWLRVNNRPPLSRPKSKRGKRRTMVSDDTSIYIHVRNSYQNVTARNPLLIPMCLLPTVCYTHLSNIMDTWE